MEELKSWEEMTTLEQYACTYWDMYKDAFGIRPRGIDTSAWTEADYLSEFKQLGEIIERENEMRQLAQHEAAHAFEMRMLSIIACGAKDRTMALRWIHEAEGSNGDDDYLCYLIGLSYGYLRKEALGSWEQVTV
jgi:hypothetical protein